MYLMVESDWKLVTTKNVENQLTLDFPCQNQNIEDLILRLKKFVPCKLHIKDLRCG